MFGLFRKKKKNAKQTVEKTPTKQEVIQEVDEEHHGAVQLKEENVEQKGTLTDKESDEPEKKRKASNHITKHPQGGWQIKKSGASRALKRFRTQKEAIEFAKNLEESTGTSFIIHKADGKTRKKTY